jgi:hypothetical protein
MDPRTREALGWGLVGSLAFLVLALGYVLVTDRSVPLPALFAVAVVVFGVASGATYAIRPRVAAGAADDSARNESP